MVDRRKQADCQKRRAELQRRLHEADRDHRGADAGKEDHHHVPAAPAVAEPAGDQRAGPEGDEARGGVRQQFRIGHAERRTHDDDGGRENEHRVMVDEMGRVNE
jgi:hypothetical protein